MPFIIGGTGKRLEGFSASKILPMCYGDHDRLVHTKGEAGLVFAATYIPLMVKFIKIKSNIAG